tara:strand:+ start:122 stop:628 length:507 start_codon:yes stop_codon:yes gene_type:complete
MAVNGQSCIWRDSTETLSSDKIEFNSGAVVNEQGRIIQTKFAISSSVAVNEMPGAVDKLQDTGVQGITIYVTGSIEDPKTSGALTAHKFKEWMLEDKTTTSTYPKGRFGLRLNDFDVLNLTPGTDRGYILSNIEFIRDGETKGKLQFVATLRFNGTIGSPNGSGQYIW